MVPILARQAVIIKCQAGNGIILSNYECAYGAGLLCRLAGKEAKEWDGESMEELLKNVLAETAGWQPEDVPAKALLMMLTKYEPDGTSDEQMRQLYQMGAKEQRLWER